MGEFLPHARKFLSPPPRTIPNVLWFWVLSVGRCEPFLSKALRSSFETSQIFFFFWNLKSQERASRAGHGFSRCWKVVSSAGVVQRCIFLNYSRVNVFKIFQGATLLSLSIWILSKHPLVKDLVSIRDIGSSREQVLLPKSSLRVRTQA